VYAFQAGEEILLENGFDSGNNFIVEIVPCVPNVTVISSKPEPEEFITEYFKKDEFQNDSHNIESNINVKAYPTIEVDEKITLEIAGFKVQSFSLRPCSRWIFRISHFVLRISLS
jgi:hypothetical protein